MAVALDASDSEFVNYDAHNYGEKECKNGNLGFLKNPPKKKINSIFFYSKYSLRSCSAFSWLCSAWFKFWNIALENKVYINFINLKINIFHLYNKI